MSNGLTDAYYRRFQWIILSLLGLVEFVRGAMFIALVPVYIPHLAPMVNVYVPHHLRITVRTTVFLSGAIISAMYGADTISKPSAGWLVDFFGPRITLLLSLPCALLGLSTFLWSKSGVVLAAGGNPLRAGLRPGLAGGGEHPGRAIPG